MKFEKIYLISLLFLWGCSSVTTTNFQSSSIGEERFQGKIKIGMTQEQVRENWGTPDGRDY